MNIKVLGSGCAKCKQLEANVRKAVEEAGIDATVEKVTDIAQIMNYGVMMTPALVVDETVKSVGKVLSPKEITQYIKK
jgi:small redox-active disulfide protein 2